MECKIAFAGLFAIAFSGIAAAGPYDPIWIDMTTGSGPRIFVNIESIAAIGEKRTAELLFSSDGSAWPPKDKLEVDCGSQTYRLSPTAKWQNDDLSNVRRICKRDFAGLPRYFADELGMKAEVRKELAPSGTYLQRSTQSYFPRDLAGFHRTQMNRISDREDNVQAWYEQPSKFGKATLIVGVFPLDEWYGPNEVDNPNPDKVGICSGHRTFMRHMEAENGRVEAEVADEVEVAGRKYAHFGGSYLVDRNFEGYGVAPGRFRTETYCDVDANRVVEFWFEQPAAEDSAVLDRIIKEGPFPGRRIK